MGVATTAPATILTGEELSGTDLATWYNIISALSAVWTPWTPVWGASTTSPTVGNGAVTGTYTQIGKLFYGLALITVGSTTTAGSGNYTITLPPGITLASGNAWEALGAFSMRDVSVPTLYGFTAMSTAATTVGAAQGSSRWSASNPVVVGTGDTVSFALFGNCA